MSTKKQRIDFSIKFNKQLKRSSLGIKESFRERLEIFLKDPSNIILNNHALSGKYSGYRSINITGDYRAIYSIRKVKFGNKVIVFELLGTHSQLYG